MTTTNLEEVLGLHGPLVGVLGAEHDAVLGRPQRVLVHRLPRRQRLFVGVVWCEGRAGS